MHRAPVRLPSALSPRPKPALACHNTPGSLATCDMRAPTRRTRAAASGVRVMLDVTGGLELEGRVLDIEVVAQARLQPLEDRTRPSVA